MADDSQEAVEALIESDSYVNKKAAQTIAESLFLGFQTEMNLTLWSLILMKTEAPKELLDGIRTRWEEKSTEVLKVDAKRFQEVILKSAATESKKLPEELQSIFSDYSRTLTTAFGLAAKEVDKTIELLTAQLTKNKETENDESRTAG